MDCFRLLGKWSVQKTHPFQASSVVRPVATIVSATRIRVTLSHVLEDALGTAQRREGIDARK